jgi:hypothetical protein
MRVLRAILLAATLALALPLSATPTTAHAASCEFILGFKAIHDLIPDRVGNCLVNEYHGTNGDGLQETTAWHGKGGLLVWRKADNWTAFTDGASTWVNGPRGLLQRRNNERFCDFEANPEKLPCVGGPSPTATPTQTTSTGSCGVVTQSGAQKEADGSVTWTGVVRNTCQGTMTLLVDVRAYQGDGGPAMMDSRPIIAMDVPAGASRDISTRLPASASAARFGALVANFDAATRGCMGPNSTRCLTDDPYVASGIWALRSVEGGTPLVQTASNVGIQVERMAFPDQVLAGYSSSQRAVFMNTAVDKYSIWVRGAVLAHEFQHVADGAAGRWPTDEYSCYHFEEHAFQTQANIWNAMWQGRLPANVDPMHAELNGITTMIFRDPEGFFKRLPDTYKEECAP